MADRVAGFAENRRADKVYKRQTDRAITATVDAYVDSKGKQGKNMPADDDTVNLDLGDKFHEHHHHGRQGSGLLGKVLPWVLATAMGPLGAVLAAWWVGGESESQVNVQDVQSKFKVEVYDEKGTLIHTLPYAELSK